MRFGQRSDMVTEVATKLVETMVAIQTTAGSVSLCLTGGDCANEILDEIARQAPGSALQTQAIHVWWNWDLFIATDNPERNSLQALTRLAGVLALDPAKIHPIPSSAVATDPETGAAQYSQELAEAAPIDICLLELGPQGQVGGIFPQNLGASSELVTGVADAPGFHRPLITLTRAGLNTCRDIWIMASGTDVAPVLRRADDGDPTLPSSYLGEIERPLWLLDEDACSQLRFHHCTL